MSDLPVCNNPRAEGTQWMFTWNNPPETAHATIQALFDNNTAKHIVHQNEVGENGTPHIQGYICFTTKKRLSAARLLLPVHWTKVTRGTAQRCIAYCKKAETAIPDSQVELGDYAPPGTRNDLEEFRMDVQNGMSYNELQDKHDKVFANSKGFADDYYNRRRPQPLQTRAPFENREWHAVCNDYIDQPDDRTVMFIVDKDGGMGKTTYAQNLLAERNDVQYLKPEKEANIALLLDQDKTIFLFDCPRSRLDIPLPYNTIEGIKDGHVLSGKYQSCMKKFTVPNTVIVFTNEAPDPTRFSHDRWRVMYRRNNNLFHCVPTETDSWDVMSHDRRHRLSQITNHDIEKRKRKRQREDQQDEALQIRLNRSRTES